METVQLKKGKLEVSVNVFGAESRDSLRFDGACRVASIKYDGVRICRPEQIIKTRRTSNGYGLSYEWVMDESSFGSKKDEYFPKLGVGLIRQDKDLEPYDIFKKYDVEFSDTCYKAASDKLVVTEKLKECCGISAELIWTVTLFENRISIKTEIKNTGNAPIKASQYGHNFVALDDALMGPGYKLTMHCLKDVKSLPIKSIRLTPEGLDESFTVLPFDMDKKSLSFTRALDNEAIFVSGGTDEIAYKDEQFDSSDDTCLPMWTLTYDKCPVTITGKASFAPASFAIWGNEQVICPELFKRIDIAPGETDSFIREYEFS
ncbi:MAG: hypothetical protein K6D96_04570 [Acetatifactor sp.]|nr:hypothetical protein [Acetatifactor sp.]